MDDAVSGPVADDARARFDDVLQSDAALAEDFTTGGDALLVAFGGLAGAPMGLPPFEFRNLSESLSVMRLFVRDPAQAWYQRGLEGLTDDVKSTADHLAERIDHAGAKRVVMVGNSMGGYAALLFGALLDVDAVIAFAPQTFIGRWLRLRHRDGRWSRQVKRAQTAPRGRARQRDLLPLLRGLAPARVAAQIHYGCDEPLDGVHAERLASLSWCHVEGHPVGGHTLVRHLRDGGRLDPMLRAALGMTA